ncbi:hypothetical protein B0O80DRAFT_450458 [Mortierella sp. GBAus27b]|nr:hypothetical protein B0O80DRAFT_450458 [Mortierella sp. GBAus27b]
MSVPRALEEDLLYGIVTGYVNPIDKTPLDVPKTTSLGTGDKENRPSARKNCHSVQPSSRSLYTYFSKSTAPSPRSTVETGEHVQKREPLKDAGAQPKMRVVEKSHTTETTPLSDALVPQDSSSACQEQLSSTAKTVCAVTVEARSRYFKVEASTPSEAIQSRSLKRSYPAPERGDSGIGLDEAYLLHTSYAGGHLSNEDALYLGPATERSKHLSEPVSTRSSSFQPAARTSSDEEQALEFKKAEAKVIQGWREKFSNPSGIGIGQTTGLTRAGQANRSSSKHTGRPKTTSAVPGHRRQGMLGIVRTTPSYPSHSLSTAKPRTETHSMSGPPVSQCGSDASQDVPEAAPCLLNLERFKYTPSASASSASTSSTAGGGGGGGGA